MPRPALRYVVLYHPTPPGFGRPSHWDLMLADGQGLLTWALEQPPVEEASSEPIAAEALALHRLDYLDYEGEISGGRGEVSRWDQGEYTWLERSSQLIRVRLAGQRWRGVVELSAGACRAAATPKGGEPPRPEPGHLWTVSFAPE